MLLSVLFISATGCTAKSKAPYTYKLAWFPLTQPADRGALRRGDVSLPDTTPNGLPLLSDADFVSYDPTNHVFTVTASAAFRLVRTISNGRPSLLDVLETPFVVAAEGTPIYVGIISSPFSSTLYPIPTVWISPTVSANDTVDVSVGRGFDLALSKKDSPSTDPRNDPRILQALQKLGILNRAQAQ